MNRLVFGTLFVVGLATLVSMTYAAVTIDDREARLFMAFGGVLGLIVTGFSAFAFFEQDPDVGSQLVAYIRHRLVEPFVLPSHVGAHVL